MRIGQAWSLVQWVPAKRHTLAVRFLEILSSLAADSEAISARKPTMHQFATLSKDTLLVVRYQ